jgi:hypothetical protein
LNKSNPNCSISIDNKNKSHINNRKHYISPIQNLKMKNYKVNNIKQIKLKAKILENKNNKRNNNINISKATKEDNIGKINYYLLKNENVMNGIKKKVLNEENPLREIFNIQKKLNISNNEIKTHNINSLKIYKSPQIKNKNYMNLFSSKNQDHSGNKKYNLKNGLFNIKNLNNKNLINFTQYNNIINNPFDLNKNKTITLFKKNSLVNKNQLKKIKLNQFENEFSNKKRKIYNSPMTNRTNNQSKKAYIYNNNNAINNSTITPTNNNFNFNIINNRIINAKIQRKLICQNNDNFIPENLNNNINIAISGNKNEYKRIFTFNK